MTLSSNAEYPFLGAPTNRSYKINFFKIVMRACDLTFCIEYNIIFHFSHNLPKYFRFKLLVTNLVSSAQARDVMMYSLLNLYIHIFTLHNLFHIHK